MNCQNCEKQCSFQGMPMDVKSDEFFTWAIELAQKSFWHARLILPVVDCFHIEKLSYLFRSLEERYGVNAVELFLKENNRVASKRRATKILVEIGQATIMADWQKIRDILDGADDQKLLCAMLLLEVDHLNSQVLREHLVEEALCPK